MSIPVACLCGQRFMAQPHLAGTQVRCPVCGQAINVPLPGHAAYAPQPAPPPQRSGSGIWLVLGVLGGGILLLMVAAVAAVFIGYDLARTTLKPAKPKAKNEIPADKPAANPPTPGPFGGGPIKLLKSP